MLKQKDQILILDIRSWNHTENILYIFSYAADSLLIDWRIN